MGVRREIESHGAERFGDLADVCCLFADAHCLVAYPDCDVACFDCGFAETECVYAEFFGGVTQCR